MMRDPAGLLFCVRPMSPGSLNDENARTPTAVRPIALPSTQFGKDCGRGSFGGRHSGCH